MLIKPTEINILGKVYKITYVDKPSDVDIYKRESLWGQIDYWTRTIRVYDNNASEEDIWEILWHEMLHGIAESLKLKSLQCNNDEEKHNDLGVLALAITDTLYRNGWFKKEGSAE